MSRSANLRRTESGHSRAQASNAIGARRTKSVPRTESGRLLPKGVAAKVSEALENYSEGEVAVAVDTSKDTAQSWKLGRRAANSAYMLGLGKCFDEVGMLIADEIDAGRFYGHDGRMLKTLRQYAVQETPEGQVARKILREVGLQ